MAIPVRGPLPKPAPPTPVPGLTKGLMRVANSFGQPPPGAVPPVQRYPAAVGPLGQASGIQPVPAPQGAAPGLADSRLRLIQFLKSSRKPSPQVAQMLQQLQGGGRPQGPLYQGFQTELVRTLLRGA